MNHPTIDECERLLDKYNTPDHVKGHCRAVARVACTVGHALNRHGYNLNLDVIRAASLLHDIARVEDKHWEVGAKWVEQEGYTAESRIIKVHMTYTPFSPVGLITETDMVCLGDKLVMEDQYVGLERRIQYVIDKAERNGHPEAKPIIKDKMKEAEKFITEIEAVIGTTIDLLMKEEDDV